MIATTHPNAIVNLDLKESRHAIPKTIIGHIGRIAAGRVRIAIPQNR